jgi:hypothetical protein
VSARRRIALALHGLALRLCPEIGFAVQQVVIENLAAERDKRQALVDQAEQMFAKHRAIAARAAQNN